MKALDLQGLERPPVCRFYNHGAEQFNHIHWYCCPLVHMIIFLRKHTPEEKRPMTSTRHMLMRNTEISTGVVINQLK